MKKFIRSFLRRKFLPKTDDRTVDCLIAECLKPLKAVFEAAPSGMVVVSRERRMALVNAQMEKLIGYGREELIGRPVEILAPEKHRDRHATLWTEFFAGSPQGLGWRRDLSIIRKDGGEVPVEIGLSAIETDGGPMVLAAMKDITEQKKIELMEREFISIVSHELRTPLTSIRGSLGLMTEGAAGKLSRQGRTLLKIAVTNCDRLGRLIDNMLDIEKIESGNMPFHLEPVDLGCLLDETVGANRGYAKEYGVHIQMVSNIDGAMVHADRDLLIRVLTNLISNAIKFSPRGKAVEVALKRYGKLLRTSVRDHGPGIPIPFQPHVFEKFAQANILNHKRRGTGLGLSISKAIVERLGGSIGFETAVNEGTTFFFLLPEWCG